MQDLKRLKNSSFTFKKSLGQNFILDTNFLEKLVTALNITQDDTIVEIGAGAGTLTSVLAARAHRVIAFEIDARLDKYLRAKFNCDDKSHNGNNEHSNNSKNNASNNSYTCHNNSDNNNNNCYKCNNNSKNNVKIICADALKVTKTELINLCGAPYKVVANIPYYITTPLLFKFLHDENCHEICVLVQDDVARRIVAQPRTKDYGALSVAMQIGATCEIVKQVPRTHFTPIPNVDSAFVRCKKINAPTLATSDLFNTMLKKLFGFRRKTLANSISMAYKTDKTIVDAILSALSISPQTRCEELTPNQFVALHEAILSQNKT